MSGGKQALSESATIIVRYRSSVERYRSLPPIGRPTPVALTPGKSLEIYHTGDKEKFNAVNPEDADSTHHVHDDDLQLYILGRLTAAEVDVLERHVFQCAECSERLATIARIVAQLVQRPPDDRGSDKRSEPRVRTSDAGFLRSFSPLLPDGWPVQIIDVSKNGLGLVVPTQLSLGSLVQVQIGGTFALGEVRYSKQISEREFRTGIRLQDVVGLRKK
jgi:hypothetical protein